MKNDYISRHMALDELNQQIQQCDKALADINISAQDEYAVTVERASLKAYKEQLEYLPSADAVEVVRCNDCISHGLCRFEQWLGLDGFCSHGERKNE